MKVERIDVCKVCLSASIVDVDCVCVTHSKYETVTIEFEVCECCGQMKDEPADTEFNKKQLMGW